MVLVVPLNVTALLELGLAMAPRSQLASTVAAGCPVAQLDHQPTSFEDGRKLSDHIHVLRHASSLVYGGPNHAFLSAEQMHML